MSQISLEEPRQLIIELAPKFKSTSDVSSILKINNKIKEIHHSRQKILEASRENVQVWTRKVELIKLESLRPSHLTEERHAEKMLALDREKFVLAKNIRDTENIIEGLESQLMQMQQEFAALKKANIEPVEASETELRLRIYRALGISAAEDLAAPSSESAPIRLRICSPNANDVHTLVLDHSKYSDFFYTNYIWEMASLE